jgi:hypothetical protein
MQDMIAGVVNRQDARAKWRGENQAKRVQVSV